MFRWIFKRRRDIEARRQRCRPQVENLEKREQPAVSLKIGPAINASMAGANQNEQSIAVNPLNPNQVVVFSNTENIDGDPNFDGGLFSAYSHDGGKTWFQQNLFTDDTLPEHACCDPQAVWDSFGNLWLIYLTLDGNVGLALSTDAGQSFTTQQLTTTDDCDQPSIAWGTGPGGSVSVWITYFIGSPTPRQEVQGFIVAGKGFANFLPNGFPQLVPGSELVNGQFGDIAVGPSGEVAVTYHAYMGPAATGAGPTQIFVNVDPDGFGPRGFGPRVLATGTNVGGARIIPATSNNLGIDPEPSLSIDRSHGKFRGRMYLTYSDAANTTTTDIDVMLRHSDDMGLTWSAPRRVNDVATGSQFNQDVVVDQFTGMVGLGWYDTRNGGTTSAEFFVTVSDDGGKTFAKNRAVSAGLSTSNLMFPISVGVRPLGYGDFNKIDFVNGNLQLCWADNSVQLLGNPDGPRSDIAVARVKVTSSSGLVGQKVRAFFSNFRLLSVGAALYSGSIAITNVGRAPLRGPVKVHIKLPHRSMQLRLPGAVRDGGLWTFTLKRGLFPGQTTRISAKIFSPFSFKISPAFTTGFAISQA
jgi:hypothetical protein